MYTKFPPEVREALSHVVDYLWENERNDWLSQSRSQGADRHVFRSLSTVKAWFLQTSLEPDFESPYPHHEITTATRDNVATLVEFWGEYKGRDATSPELVLAVSDWLQKSFSSESSSLNAGEFRSVRALVSETRRLSAFYELPQSLNDACDAVATWVQAESRNELSDALLGGIAPSRHKRDRGISR